ncbi:hypothetical protein BDL97_08G004700 [Sphagnum fallax]|nr:hypothetical protein BDL97_08G004700 [Sphagnum fallax]
MLYSLYTIVLDVSKPLELIILVHRQFGFEDPDPVLRSHDILQLAIREAWKLLGKAMSERYFKRYDPILALRQPKKIYDNNLGRPMLLKNVLEETDFKFSYLIDAQSMLPAKRVKTLELLSVALDIVANDDKKDVNGSGERFEMATQMVNTEVQILKRIGVETNIKLWPKSVELCKWWARQTSMPCLMHVVLAILANKPSSGGLECDLGSLLDVLAPKRSSLRVGLVDINMFLKINKHLILTNPAEVAPLDKKMNWENNIPKWPVMALYDGGEEEEKEEEDTNDDNDNSPV